MLQLFILTFYVIFISIFYPINCVNLKYILSPSRLRWVRKFNPHTSNASTFYKCVLRDVIVYYVQLKCLGLCWYCCQWWWHDDPRDLHLYFSRPFYRPCNPRLRVRLFSVIVVVLCVNMLHSLQNFGSRSGIRNF